LAGADGETSNFIRANLVISSGSRSALWPLRALVQAPPSRSAGGGVGGAGGVIEREFVHSE
jgi:hypothetical protein